MARQHTQPIFIPTTGAPHPLPALSLQGGEGALLEADIQALVHAFPEMLPIREIDSTFVGAVPICREMQTRAGFIDNFLVTPSGLPILVECKLWRNAEARREVVGQILDYAKELTLFTASDIRREASARAGGDPDALLKLIRAADPTVDELAFEDALTANLKNGRIMLLVVGEGIREGVERIAEFLQNHAGLRFTFGLVELPFYDLPGHGRLVVPRILARTEVIPRTVIELPPGYALAEPAQAPNAELDPETQALGDLRQAFWTEFLKGLHLDDPDQPMPRPPRQGYVTFPLPAPGGTSWLTVYRDMRNNEVGVFLSGNRASAGERAMQVIDDAWAEVGPQLGPDAQRSQKDGRPYIFATRRQGNLGDAMERAAAFDWLRAQTNTFINVLRPLVRSAVANDASA